MAGLVPATPIVWHSASIPGIAGTSPAMTRGGVIQKDPMRYCASGVWSLKPYFRNASKSRDDMKKPQM
jgi:hypothetical protein